MANNETATIPVSLYQQLCRLGIIDTEGVRDYNIGKSNYSDHLIQPWSIWIDYPELNAFEDDIIKRVLRHKMGEARRLDYEKIIHICKELIRQIDVEEGME